MNIGERIKERRKELGLSVEDVAKKLNKNRATIYRYESSEIENLPISILEPLSKILYTTPSYLMGWENYELNVSKKINEAEKLKNTDNYSKEEKNHIEDLRNLNDIGKEKVITYTKDLLDNPKFNKNNDISCTIRDIEPVVEDDGYVPRVFAAHSDGIDEETNRRNIEMIKRLELEKRRKKNNQ